MSQQLDQETLKLANFFKARFKKTPAQDPTYFEEWQYRQKTGQLFKNMDNESMEAWLSLGPELPGDSCFICRLTRGCPGNCPHYREALRAEEARSR